jgi:hypothetical protein
VSTPPLDRNQKMAANCPTATLRIRIAWKMKGRAL